MSSMSAPWSKKHKLVNKHGTKHSLSNSYAQPLTQAELIQYTLERQDTKLVEQYYHHSLGYTSNGGSLDLRQEVANLYGPNITPEHVLIFTGAQVALQTAALAFAAQASSHSIVFTPGYQSTVSGPSLVGGYVTQIPLSASNNWQITLEQVKQAIKPGITNYMVINEPFNPAGTLMSKQNQKELIAIANQYNIIIMSDEVYRLLEHDSNDRLPAMCDAYPSNGISCVTLSKPWGGCGVTIGWLVLSNLSMKQKLVDIQYFGTACPSRASEIQAIMTLRASDKILAKNLKIIRFNLLLLTDFMIKYNEFFSWVKPSAGAVCFLKFQGSWSSEELGSRLAKEAGISMKPAYCFSDIVPMPEEIDYFRIGYGEEKTFPIALNALAEFVESYSDEWKKEMIGRLFNQKIAAGWKSRL